MIKNIRMPGSDKVVDIWDEFFHTAHLFPEDTNETVTFTAPGTANTWSAWAEIVDNNAVTLSSKMTDYIGHIAYIIVETSTTGKAYVVEIAYGSAKTNVGRAGFYGGAVPKQAQRMHSPTIPKGEAIYYRIKCEQASQALEVHIRYHYH